VDACITGVNSYRQALLNEYRTVHLPSKYLVLGRSPTLGQVTVQCCTSISIVYCTCVHTIPVVAESSSMTPVEVLKSIFGLHQAMSVALTTTAPYSTVGYLLAPPACQHRGAHRGPLLYCRPQYPGMGMVPMRLGSVGVSSRVFSTAMPLNRAGGREGLEY